ncbi:hypothetical protein AB6A40_000891 [Gnathostoma spinigerum]|uniref:Trafficking protein particle complex subunit n=1 Tax=Gnathostoma spinigerum TaxID=75299 RepID=A0ABD6ECF7_9BILA
MSIYQIFIISPGGSLMFDWELKNNEMVGVEKTVSYPMSIVLEIIDQKATVVFGELDGVGLRYTVAAVNSCEVKEANLNIDNKKWDILDYLSVEAHYPLTIRFTPPVLSANEKMILSSTFHSLYAIAVRLSPKLKSSGIELLTTTQFKLHCFQSTAGVKFVVVCAANSTGNFDALLRKIYELYADFALKNPFYKIDNPIRCQRFDDAIRTLIEKHDKSLVVTI